MLCLLVHSPRQPVTAAARILDTFARISTKARVRVQLAEMSGGVPKTLQHEGVVVMLPLALAAPVTPPHTPLDRPPVRPAALQRKFRYGHGARHGRALAIKCVVESTYGVNVWRELKHPNVLELYGAHGALEGKAEDLLRFIHVAAKAMEYEKYSGDACF
ncbi:hypothetical protein B0H17DRAFT_1214585 [Mycena rosella]|uniref:Protein kinase domain-containing protein n=1 Tax=Mycena rosella TaxID=1033263 RepID=A0AAD7CMQ7_MYCRO|nr:hypothetical protein B0H17DRAFT_1214585 [Mycena rosella]